MSISTRNGDDGSTALLFGRRVSKDDPRVRAYGAVDELTAALGLARAAAADSETAAFIRSVQQDLVCLMAELAVADEDHARFMDSKLSRLDEAALGRLDRKVAALEASTGGFKGWVLPGDSEPGARLELARVQCRRCEREMVALVEGGRAVRAGLLKYLNRLSDCLWLLARAADAG